MTPSSPFVHNSIILLLPAAAGYDWRLAPNQLRPYFDNLTELITTITQSYPSSPRVSLYAASDGAMMMLAYLDYVRKNASLGQLFINQTLCGLYLNSGAYAGTPGAIEMLTNGVHADLDSNLISAYPLLRNVIATWPVVYWNLPRVGNGNYTYNSTQILVHVANAMVDMPSTYAAPELADFIGAVYGADFPFIDLYKHVANMTSIPFPQPALDTVVCYGYGTSTPVTSGRFAFIFCIDSVTFSSGEIFLTSSSLAAPHKHQNLQMLTKLTATVRFLSKVPSVQSRVGRARCGK